ncbi:hypothetical protein HK105_204028 [Polyrhizophydium stewartii]|uniref:Uncharacterized protein n=1 Tax=Polyrhizophydium stewartii TaxID=2732419 RepID=A0ABR4N9U8_9FUNG
MLARLRADNAVLLRQRDELLLRSRHLQHLLGEAESAVSAQAKEIQVLRHAVSEGASIPESRPPPQAPPHPLPHAQGHMRDEAYTTISELLVTVATLRSELSLARERHAIELQAAESAAVLCAACGARVRDAGDAAESSRASQAPSRQSRRATPQQQRTTSATPRVASISPIRPVRPLSVAGDDIVEIEMPSAIMSQIRSKAASQSLHDSRRRPSYQSQISRASPTSRLTATQIPSDKDSERTGESCPASAGCAGNGALDAFPALNRAGQSNADEAQRQSPGSDNVWLNFEDSRSLSMIGSLLDETQLLGHMNAATHEQPPLVAQAANAAAQPSVTKVERVYRSVSKDLVVQTAVASSYLDGVDDLDQDHSGAHFVAGRRLLSATSGSSFRASPETAQETALLVRERNALEGELLMRYAQLRQLETRFTLELEKRDRELEALKLAAAMQSAAALGASGPQLYHSRSDFTAAALPSASEPGRG